jgi:hypothetical protein
MFTGKRVSILENRKKKPAGSAVKIIDPNHPCQITASPITRGCSRINTVVDWLVGRLMGLLMESLCSYAGGDSHKNGASTP